MFPTYFASNDKHPYGGLNPHNKINQEISKDIVNIILNVKSLDKIESFVDFGCGTGRILFALKDHVPPEKYLGIDCNEDYLKILDDLHHYPTFHTDTIHPLFNPDGQTIELKIPKEDASVDFVLCVATTNHMNFEMISQFLQETSRILKPDGLCLTTWFALSSYYHNVSNLPTFKFDYKKGNEYHVDKECSYKNVAYSECDIRKIISDSKLRIVEPIRYGEWQHGPNPFLGHDLILIRKRI